MLVVRLFVISPLWAAYFFHETHDATTQHTSVGAIAQLSVPSPNAGAAVTLLGIE